MNVVTIFSDEFDERISRRITSILNYMGFYVINSNQSQPEKIDTGTDVFIYVVNSIEFANALPLDADYAPYNKFSKFIYVVGNSFDIEDVESDSGYRVIMYTETISFFKILFEYMTDILEWNPDSFIHSDDEEIIDLVKRHENDNMLEVQFLQGIYTSPEIHKIIKEKYVDFMDEIEEFFRCVNGNKELSDFGKYIHLYSMYKILISANKYYIKDTDGFLPKAVSLCEELLQRHENIEMIHIIRAELFEVADKLFDACDAYGDDSIIMLPYASYCRAHIYNNYGESANARICCANAAQTGDWWLTKKSTFLAAVLLAEENAMKGYKVLKDVLPTNSSRFKNRILSPSEIDLYFFTYTKLANLAKWSLDDSVTARNWALSAERIRDEWCFEVWMNLVFPYREISNIIDVEQVKEITLKRISLSADEILSLR